MTVKTQRPFPFNNLVSLKRDLHLEEFELKFYGVPSTFLMTINVIKHLFQTIYKFMWYVHKVINSTLKNYCISKTLGEKIYICLQTCIGLANISQWKKKAKTAP